MDTPSNMLTLANRGDLAPRARHLLAQQLAECGDLLEPLLRNVLDDLERELFRVAEQSSGGQAQHEAMEALENVRCTRPGFQNRLVALLKPRFDNAGAPQAGVGVGVTAPENNDGALALVDPAEFDETMALDDLSTRTELHAGNGLFELGLRYAVLLAAPPVEDETLPPGPRGLAAVLNQAAAELGLERQHRVLFYRLCDRRLLGASESFYARLNEHLKTSGILPHLRSYLPRRASARRGPEALATDDAVGATPDPDPGVPITEFTPTPAPRMNELHALLDARRQALHPDTGATASPAASFAGMPELQEALAALQAMPSRKSHRPEPGERLAGELLGELRRAPHDQTIALKPEHRDAMDLVGLLYDGLRSETRDQGVAQQLLARLQVPLLRVALSDSDFFTVRDHPARRLLNLVLETANLWLDLNDDPFDSALNQRLQHSVERIVAEYQGDMGVIERETNALDAHLRVLARRAEIAERRQIEAARGRDRLREARASADEAIRRRLANLETTPLVRALLENAWVDVLTLTLLREGENSDAYRRRLAVADQLLGPPRERDDARLAQDLNQGLTQVGLQAVEADEITRCALDLPESPASSGRASLPSRTELLIRLKSRRRSGGDTTSTPPEPVPLPLAPGEREAVEQLKKLPFGSWLEFTINQQGQKVRRKLAWFSPTSGRCLLVNARGTAAPERTLAQIARMQVRGQVRLMPRANGGMIDRAWNTLVASLRKFGRSNEPTEPTT